MAKPANIGWIGLAGQKVFVERTASNKQCFTIQRESGGTNKEYMLNNVFKINVKQCGHKNNALMKKQREMTSTFCVLRHLIVPLQFLTTAIVFELIQYANGHFQSITDIHEY